MEDVVPFVDTRQEDVAEVDGPDSVGHFLEAEDLLLERVRDEEQALLEPDRARIRHALGTVVAGVLDRRDDAGRRTRRRAV